MNSVCGGVGIDFDFGARRSNNNYLILFWRIDYGVPLAQVQEHSDFQLDIGTKKILQRNERADAIMV